MPRLSVDSIVRINVNVLQGSGVDQNGCNIGLILGTTAPFTDVRMKYYASIDAMLADSFTETMAETKAARMYFKQVPAPVGVYVGKYDPTLTTPETPVTAYAACRDIAGDFYGVYCVGASDAEKLALAAAIDAVGDNCLFFDTDNTDAFVASPATADIFTSMKAGGYEHAIGIFSEADYAGAALMGLAMGLETGEEGSAFDLFLKKLVGVDPTANITEAQLAILHDKNGNAYILRGQNTQLIETGNCVDGTPYDETMYIDLTKRVLQNAVLEQMTAGNVPKIPQTDDGMSLIVAAVTTGLEYMRTLGFIGPGTWTAQPFRTIETGDMLPSGYQVFVDSFSALSASDRSARKSPPVYVAIKLAGSIRSVVIALNVNE